MKSAIICLFTLISGGISAQVTGGYWGNQYGSRGLLLNGAVIAGCDDETAIFYNPAGLGLTDDFGVAVSLITPTFNYVKTSDLLGDESQFVDKGLGLAPGLVAAKFRPFSTNKVNAGVSIFKRFESEVNYGERVLGEVSSVDDVIFVGDLEYERDFSETWVGLGLSFEVLSRLSLGVSQFFTWRGEDVNLDFKKEFIAENNPEQLITSWRSRYSYGYGVNGGMLTKVGLSWRPFNMKVGVTYTSSTYTYALSGADYKYNDTKVISAGIAELSSNDRSVDVAEYHTPWSIGGGLEFTLGSTRLSMSAEYFAEVSPYSIIDDTDDPFDGLSGASEEVTTVIRQGNNSVVNVALGFEKTLNKKYSWFLSGRTDFSPQSLLDVGEGISFLSTNPDIYHVAVGGAYLYKKSKFSVGIDYGFGFKSGGQQFIDLDNVNAENLFVFDGEKVVDTQSHSLSLFITYDL